MVSISGMLRLDRRPLFSFPFEVYAWFWKPISFANTVVQLFPSMQIVQQTSRVAFPFPVQAGPTTNHWIACSRKRALQKRENGNASTDHLATYGCLCTLALQRTSTRRGAKYCPLFISLSPIISLAVQSIQASFINRSCFTTSTRHPKNFFGHKHPTDNKAHSQWCLRSIYQAASFGGYFSSTST